ncbi:MAG: tetratricopeptide repeat protein, partial [Gammaproteobacteria bacterium]|nr:tetratricopeptide repeat protein [Gammaproteobacteria bacterium]
MNPNPKQEVPGLFINKALQQALNSSQLPAVVWVNRGVAHASQGRTDEAMGCYERAIEMEPEFPGGWYNKAQLLCRQERYKEGIQCIERVLEIDPNDAEAWLTKGKALEHLRSYEESLICYHQTIGLDP